MSWWGREVGKKRKRDKPESKREAEYCYTHKVSKWCVNCYVRVPWQGWHRWPNTDPSQPTTYLMDYVST